MTIADPRNHGKRVTCTLLLSIALLLPALPVSASTPPQLPSLSISAPYTIDSGTVLPVTVAWTKETWSFSVAPDQVDIALFNISSGKKVATFSLERISLSHDGTRAEYTADISCRGLASGRFMLIATDPLSGAYARRVILLRIPENTGSEILSESTPTVVVPGVFQEIRLFS